MHGNENEPDSDSDLDQADLNNYKGQFFNEEPGQKYQDPETGAHFEYNDMCAKLKRLQKEISKFEKYTEEEQQIEDPQEIGVHTFVEQKSHHKLKESGGAFKALQQLLLRSKTKDSRNAAQALPEQGYGTTEIKGKQKSRGNCARQFSTQLGPCQQLGNQQTIPLPKASRSKSIDKQHSYEPAKQNKGATFLLKDSGKVYPNVVHHIVQKTHNVDRQTVIDM